MVAADKLIKLWDSRTGEFIQNFEGHTKGISDIAWSSNSTLLASGSDDKTVRLWDVNTVISYLPHLLTSRENASRR
jgi:COMPASS component SWD3